MKIKTPILRRLGPVPFWRGEKRCLDALERIYSRAAEKASAALVGGVGSGSDCSSATSPQQARHRIRST